MKKLLNGKYTSTKTGKELLVGVLVNAIVFTIVVYIIVGPVNKDLVQILNVVSEKNLACLFTYVSFPIFLILNMMMTMSSMVIKKGKK